MKSIELESNSRSYRFDIYSGSLPSTFAIENERNDIVTPAISNYIRDMIIDHIIDRDIMLVSSNFE
jgi:hypothetical protein